MRWMIMLTLACMAGWFGGTDPASDSDSGAPAQPDNGDLVASHLSGVVGGVHDFSDAEGAGGACNACHVPHMQAFRPAPTTRPAATQPATTTQPVYQPAYEMYRMAGQRRVFVPDRYTPGPTSLICLGCHDGTVATSTIGAAHSMLAGVREGFAMPDGFVWRDHPIGVPYPTDRREYHPQGFVEKKGVRLPEGRIECVSCHDPHGEAGFDNLLILSNRRSALCLTCHIK